MAGSEKVNAQASVIYNAQLSTGRWQLAPFTSFPDAGKVRIRRDFLDTPMGQVHFRYAGLEHKDGPHDAIIFFHMNPRSSDEFREMLTLYGKTRLVCAYDMLGFGDSDRPSEDNMPLIGDYADHGKLLLDKLGVSKAVAYGNHTGAFVATELAVRHPETITRLVVANAPWFGVTEEGAAFYGKDQLWNRYKQGWHIADDGSHCMDRWKKRKHYVGSAALNHRWVMDDLKCFGYPLYAMYAVHEYVDGAIARMTEVASSTKVCVLWGDIDVQEFERLGLARCVDNSKIENLFPGAVVKRCAAGTICMTNQIPYEIFHVLNDWLDGKEDVPGTPGVVFVPPHPPAAAAAAAEEEDVAAAEPPAKKAKKKN